MTIVKPYSAKQVRNGYLTGIAALTLVATWATFLLTYVKL